MADKKFSVTGDQGWSDIYKILVLISGGKSVILSPTGGKETLANSEDTFTIIDSKFKNPKLNKPSKATKKTTVLMCEMNEAFQEMFGFCSNSLSALCLTQPQIKQFVVKYQNLLLGKGCGTFFLSEDEEATTVKEKFFIVHVSLLSGNELMVRPYLLESAHICYSQFGHRIVIPQFTLRT